MKLHYIWLLVAIHLAGAQDELIEYINSQLILHKKPEITLPSVQHQEECQICFDLIVSHEEPRPVLEINCYTPHRFHHVCAKGWFEKNKTCPLCRNPVNLKKQLPEQSEGFFSWLFKLLCCRPSSQNP